jgi:hypothetical protein
MWEVKTMDCMYYLALSFDFINGGFGDAKSGLCHIKLLLDGQFSNNH